MIGFSASSAVNLVGGLGAFGVLTVSYLLKLGGGRGREIVSYFAGVRWG